MVRVRVDIEHFNDVGPTKAPKVGPAGALEQSDEGAVPPYVLTVSRWMAPLLSAY